MTTTSLRSISFAIFASLLLLAVAVPPPAEAQQKLTVGLDASYAPFAYVTSSGEMTGFDVDFIKAVCKQMKAECELRNVPWDGIFAALEAGKIDIIAAAVNITDQRKQKYLMPGPYFKAPMAWMVTADSTLDGMPASLKGKTVGVPVGSVFEKYLQDKYAGMVTIKTYDSMDAAALDLNAGRIDAIFGEEPQLIFAYVKPKPDQYKMTGAPIVDAAYMGQGKGLVVRKDDAALADALNKAIRAVIADGEHAQIATKYFGKPVPAQ
jgi:lysine-arginine-ornithine-binding protein